MESARVAIERLRQAIEDLAIPRKGKTPPGILTVSVGLAKLSSGEKKSVEVLLMEADDALYAAKEAGRNRIMTRSGMVGA